MGSMEKKKGAQKGRLLWSTIKRLGQRAPGIQTAKDQMTALSVRSPRGLCLQKPPIPGVSVSFCMVRTQRTSL